MLLIVVICAFMSDCFAQNSKPIEFSEVVDVNGVSANELKSRCLNWFAVAFNNSDKVLVPSSDDQLIAKPLIDYKPSVVAWNARINGPIKYTLQVQFKDNKFRYILSDFIHEGNPLAAGGSLDFGLITNDAEYSLPIKGATKAWKDKVWNDIKFQIDQSILPLIENLKHEMVTVSKKNDNW